METHVRELSIAGVLLFTPRIFSDARGSFVEFWNGARESSAGFDEQFVQDNIAVSKHRVLRGLHFQHPDAQGKFVTAAYGRIYDVVVDLRSNSPTFKRWIAVDLDASQGYILFIPPGFAHGYQVVSDDASVVYKCTKYYKGANDRVLAWNDPTLAISWPLDNPILSEKDSNAPNLSEVIAQCGF